MLSRPAARCVWVAVPAGLPRVGDRAGARLKRGRAPVRRGAPPHAPVKGGRGAGGSALVDAERNETHLALPIDEQQYRFASFLSRRLDAAVDIIRRANLVLGNLDDDVARAQTLISGSERGRAS